MSRRSKVFIVLGVIAVFFGGFVLGRLTADWGFQNPIQWVGPQPQLVTPTPDPLKTAQAEMEEAESKLEEYEATVKALQSQTVEPAITVVSQSTESKVAVVTETPTIALTETPSPSSTPSEEVVHIAVVEDNGGNSQYEDANFREETIKALQNLIPKAEVIGFTGCNAELALQEFYLVIMDWQMQLSIDGGSCTKAIHFKYPNTIIIGYAMGREGDFKSAGADGYVEKPDAEALDKLVQELLEGE